MTEAAAPATKPTITIEQFMALDLRVAKAIDAVEVPEADKLVKLTLDIGGGVTKTCFAGIKKHYQVKDLIGQIFVFVNNLQPRQMKFGLSEGMILAGSNDDHSALSIITCLAGVPGWKVS